MAIDIAGGPVFQLSVPRLLFKMPLEFLRISPNPGTLADVTSDHLRFLLAMPAQELAPGLTLVLNWQSGLRR